MKHITIFIALFFLFIGIVEAKITLPDIISDNMVLQQNTNVKLWGKSEAKSMVKIRLSWQKQEITTQTDNNGKWLVSVSTPMATFSPQTIIFSDKDSKIEITNILIGEVWLVSGQSNMEMPLNGFWNNPILNGNETILKSATHKGVRFATVPKTAAYEPQETCTGKWKTSNPEDAQWFSATAYHFATTVSEALNIPIGIVSASWGGSRVESWLNKAILETYPDIDITIKGIEAETEWKRPLVMYNAMIYPLTNYTIAGFLWYQGESNVGRHKDYAQRLADMVQLWRKNWNLGELPFYFVELAPYMYNNSKDEIDGALLREAQYNAQKLIPNSAMVSTNDLVEEYEAMNIHPKNKTDIGKRLAYHALTQTYNLKGIEARGPEYRSMTINGNKITLTFDHARDGFNRLEGLLGFEIAGEDKVFYPAIAKVNEREKTITVHNDQVQKPVAVRYCFKNFQIGNVTNTRELPLVPFRTDKSNDY